MSATNIRLSHDTLPSIQIWPDISHKVEKLPGGGQEIVIPKLIPGEQITISYLYVPPLTYDKINKGIRCDQCFAYAIPVLLQRQYPKWLNRLASGLMILGIITILYGGYELVRRLG